MTTATQTAAKDSLASGNLLLTVMKLRTFIALFAVIIFFSIFAPNFLSTANMILMSKHATQNAFLAIGMTFVIITGGIDLSVGSIVGLCGMIAGGLIMYGIALPIGYTVYFNIVEVAVIVACVGILIGDHRRTGIRRGQHRRRFRDHAEHRDREDFLDIVDRQHLALELEIVAGPGAAIDRLALGDDRLDAKVEELETVVGHVRPPPG